FFPGGNIGDLAVNGTLNDLAMCGATPLFISTGMIIEEGLAVADLDRILASMQAAAKAVGARIITGDTKVVNRGKGDKIFINTAGLGILNHHFTYSGDNLKPGDRIILSGSIGDHGIAILSKREGLSFDAVVESDTACVYAMVADVIKNCGAEIHAFRDPTRGGLAAVLNEWAKASKIEIQIEESAIPILPAVNNACELLGLDPLHIANEGKFIAAVAAHRADEAIRMIKEKTAGEKAAIIGQVSEGTPGLVTMQTHIGGRRVIDLPMGELLPRIC
ncbi:hydrogenase expression/formation protein HypE, partial [candidate division KSB1 bacterium]|nr:hydrogenase expression/formation protein HypE [candidate division KSB1 bacterium]